MTLAAAHTKQIIYHLAIPVDLYIYITLIITDFAVAPALC